MSNNKARIMTPAFRVAFPEVFTPGGMDPAKPKYSITMLFDKDEDISELKRIAAAAKRDKWGEKIPSGLRNPFRNGDEKDWTGFEGKIFVKAASKFKPGLVDADRVAIIDETEFYPGCWARATITAYAYDVSGNKGVAFNLHNLQKLKDDEPFVGRIEAEDDFADAESSQAPVTSSDEDW